jgi:hypothetical protein
MNKRQSINTKPVRITIYRITGQQLFFRVPQSVCEECDLSVAIVQTVIKELNAEDRIEIKAKPWINNLIGCLLWRSWHPPVVTINGERFSQGVVPDKALLTNVLKQQLRKVSNG